MPDEIQQPPPKPPNPERRMFDFKFELLAQIPEGEASSYFKNDECINPGAFKLTTVARAHNQGNERHPRRQCSHGTAFKHKTAPGGYFQPPEAASRRDPRKISAVMGLKVYGLAGGVRYQREGGFSRRWELSRCCLNSRVTR